jgi:putative nucleotidyltransferase with HDIG domain
MGNFFGKVLIIDNNMKFVESLKEESILLNDYPCLFTKTFKDGAQILKQPKHNIRAIFISSSIGPTHGIDELKEIKKDFPLVPIFLVSHNPGREPKEIIDNVCGFTKIIRSPSNLLAFTKEIDELFKSKESWVGVEASKEEKNIELDLVADGYIPTLLSEFVLSPKCFFNIYIKLGSAKFIKVLNAGDPLNDELLQTYAKKGVTHLFISIEEHKKYIRFCEEISKKLLSRQDIGSSKKIHNVLNLGANIAQSFIHTGISQEKLDFANSFLNQSVGLIKNMKLKNESLKRFIDSIEMKEHSAAVSFLAGMIANEIGIESIKSVKLVGIAALLHDIGLYDIDPDFKQENLENLSVEQQKNFDQHQKHGGEILRTCGGFDEVIYQSVESHHMRRRGSDPSRRTNNINMVAEIIGAADELHNLFMSNSLNEMKLQYFNQNNLKNFSPQIEKAVTKLMQKKKAA